MVTEGERENPIHHFLFFFEKVLNARPPSTCESGEGGGRCLSWFQLHPRRYLSSSRTTRMLGYHPILSPSSGHMLHRPLAQYQLNFPALFCSIFFPPYPLSRVSTRSSLSSPSRILTIRNIGGELSFSLWILNSPYGDDISNRNIRVSHGETAAGSRPSTLLVQQALGQRPIP